MSTHLDHPLVPAKPREITLDTLPQLFAHHRAVFGGWSMTSTPPEPDPPAGPPQRPEGVTEDEWAALGDPGKRAIVRERERAEAAERSLAASRARPAPPKQDPPAGPPKQQDPPAGPPKQAPPAGGALTEDAIAKIVEQAVSAAVKPFQDAEQQRQADAAAGRVRDAVLDAAKARLHDSTDALTNIDLITVVNEQGGVDSAKVTAALDDLVKRKPHLAKTTERFAPPGIGGGGPAGASDADKVKAALEQMQRSTGVRTATSAASLSAGSGTH